MHAVKAHSDENKYSYTLYLTAARDVGERLSSRPGRFTPEGIKHRYPVNSRLRGPQNYNLDRIKIIQLCSPEARGTVPLFTTHAGLPVALLDVADRPA